MVIKIPLIFILILNTYLLFNSDFGNLVPETNEGGGRKHYFIFFIWGCYYRRWVRFDGPEQKVSFVFSLLVLIKEMRMRVQSNPFPCFHSFRNLPRLLKLWKKSSPTPTRVLKIITSVTSSKTGH